MSSVSILNKHFKVASYNGGSIHGPSGIHHLLNLDANQLHSTRSGQNFDLVLEYVGPNDKFTLTNFINKGFEFKLVTAPLKSTVVWVSDEPTMAQKEKYNDASATRVLEESTKQGDSEREPIPALVATTSISGTDAISCVPNGTKATVSGKYLHIKFTERYGSDINIDMGHFAIVGYHGCPNDESAWANQSKTFTPTASDYSHLFALEITRPIVISGIPNPINAAFAKNIVTSVPIVCFVSQTPTSSLETMPSNTEVSDAYAVFKKCAAHEKASQVAFICVGPDTDRSLARFIFQQLGLPYDHIVDDAGSNEDKSFKDYIEAERERERMSGYAIIDAEAKSSHYPSLGDASLQTALGAGKKFTIVAMSAEVDEEIYVYQLDEQKDVKIDNFIGQFLDAYEPKADTEELLGSSNFDTAINAATKSNEPVKVDFASSINKTGDCKLVRHVFSTARFEGDRHPLLPNVYVGVHSNFNELVVNHPDPVLLTVISGNDFDLYVASHVCAFARLLAKYAPANGPASKLRVVVWNIRDDDFPEEWEGKFSVCDFITKMAPAKDAKTKKNRLEKYGEPIGVNDAGFELYSESLTAANLEEDEEDQFDMDEEEGSDQQVPLVSTLLEKLQDRLNLPKGKLLKPFETDAKKAEAALENLNAITDGGQQIIELIHNALLPRRRFNSAASAPLVELKNTEETSPSVALVADPSTPFGKAVGNLTTIRSAANDILYTLPFPLGRLPLQRANLLAKEGEAKENSLFLDILEVADKAVQLKKQSDEIIKQFTEFTEILDKARGRYKAFLGLLDSFSGPIAEAVAKNENKLWNGFLINFVRLVRATGMPVYHFSEKLTEALEADAGMTVDKAYEKALPFHCVTPTSITEAVKPLDSVYKAALALCTTLAEEAFESKIPADLCISAKTSKEVMRVVEGYVNPKPPVALKTKTGGKGARPKAKDPKVPNANDRLVVVLIHSIDDGSVARLDEIASQMQGAIAQVEEYNSTQRELEAKGQESEQLHDVKFVRTRGDKAPELLEMLNITTMPAVCYLQASAEHASFRIEGVSGLTEFASNIDMIFSMDEEDLLDEDEDIEYEEDDDKPE